MLGHDPRGFLGERASQVFSANAQSFWHVPIIWPVGEKIKRDRATDQNSDSLPAAVCWLWVLAGAPLPGR
jgi:hypothetical protein